MNAAPTIRFFRSRLPSVLLGMIFLAQTSLVAQQQTVAETGVQLDRFGVRQLHSDAKDGRVWFANWEEAREIPKYTIDPNDPLFRNGDGRLVIANGIATAEPGLTRLVVLTSKNDQDEYTQPQWRNVEMTVYVKRGASTRSLDYQAFYLSARSGERHNDDVPCDGTSYHATTRFDGKIGFKKEIWHTGGYTKLRPTRTPKPWRTVPQDKWIGMKFVCRNCDDNQHVRLQTYLDVEETNDWRLVSEFTDQGDWRGERAGCERARDYVITEAKPAVYFRTDHVNVQLKKFSVREIDPLP